MKYTRNNFFIERNLYLSKRKKLIVVANRVLKRFGFWHQLTPMLNPMVDMCTLEQKINFFHLLSSVIENGVEGEVVELGSFTGQCAILFQQILDFNNSDKQLHLYDSFEINFTIKTDVESELRKNFNDNILKEPYIHKGLFHNTLPVKLPDKICFGHIDCGFGGDKMEHMEIVLYCLEQLYFRLSKGSICLLMDYHDATLGDPGMDCNPGVKLACDEFLKDKPENIISLYGNEVSHGYFKKQ